MADKKILPPKVEIPADLTAKLKEIKTKLDKFKTRIVKEYKKEVLAIALLPPPKPKEGQKLDKNIIDVLVITDDKDVKLNDKYLVRNKLLKAMDKIALEIDKNIKIDVMLASELKESCFDAKYEILHLIATSVPLYDPMDMLAAIKIAEVHKGMVLKKFEKYIMSYVAAGSVFRGEKSNDIDVYVIIDDTDVKKMSRYELKNKLRQIIITQGFDATDITGVQKQFHIQVYILTDFWESVKDAHPVIYTLLRDGVPLYDRGLFVPWSLLLRMGRVKPSAEAIDMQMDVGEKLIDRAKKKMLGIVMEDLVYSVLNPSQAALMLYGVAPPTPRETIALMKDIMVKKEKLFEMKYVNILTKIFHLFKDIEHGRVTDVKGAYIDKLTKDAEVYNKRIKKLFVQIEKRHEREGILDTYNVCNKVVTDVLTAADIKVKKETLKKQFEAYVKKAGLSEKLITIYENVCRGKEEYKKGKLTKAESEMIKREARTFVRLMVDHLQQKKSFELDRIKLRFKYGDKFGEVLMFDKEAFIIGDIGAKDKGVQKAKIKEDGSLGTVTKSSVTELEGHIAKTQIPAKVFIKEKIFEDLRKLFGKDIEILVNY